MRFTPASRPSPYAGSFAFLRYFSSSAGTWSGVTWPWICVVDHDHRRQAAGAQAAGGFQGEDAVLAGFAPGDAQLVHDLLRHAVGPFDVAGGAQADVDENWPRGCRRKK